MATKQENTQNPIEEEVVMESTESEIINTGFNPEKAAETEEPDVEKTKTKGKKKFTVNIVVYKILIALVVAAIFVFLAFQEKQNIDLEYKQSQESRVAAHAEKIAVIVSARVSGLQKKFASHKIPQMSQGDSLASDEILAGSRIEYYSLPFNPDEIIDNPAKGYAFLDLLNRTSKAKADQIPPMEILKPNSDYAKILTARPDINAAQDGSVSGILMLYIPPEYANQLLANIDLAGGFVKLAQGSSASAIKLASTGALITNPVTKVKPVANTHWSIHYSSALSTTNTDLTAYSLLAVYLVLALALIIFSLYAAIKYLIKLIKERKNKKLAEEKAKAGSSILESKKTISQLGMVKPEAVADKTKKKTKPADLLTKQKKDIQTIDKAIFTEYGIRGIVGEQINSEVFTLLGHGIAQEMEDINCHKLAIGYDGRTSSPELYQGLIEAIKYYQLEVIELGLVTLPVAYFAAHTLTEGSVIMITAGSSGAEYNGMKILLNNTVYSQSKLAALADASPLQAAQQCQFKQENVNHLYINQLSEKFSLGKSLNVVVDFANGVSSQIVFDLFKMLGCNIIPLNEEIDGEFPNHQPHPGKPENLQQLAQKVKSESADIGLAFNGDGTALGVVSSNSEIIWTDRVLMLLAMDTLLQDPGAKVMYDVKSTSSLHDWIIENKGEPELTPCGYSAVVERMQANKAVLCAEFSGHIYYAQHNNGMDDAFYAAAKLLQILAAFEGSSSDLFKQIPEKISTPEVLIAVQPGQQDEIMEKILSQKNEFMPAGIITLDGLRVEYEDGWGVVRKSRTSSALSLRFEADNPQVLQRIAEKFKEVILSVVFVKFPY